MCGIIGYVGKKDAVPILLEGLKTLEYRGYDSAGLFTPESGVIKSLGEIKNLATQIPKDFGGHSGIAHTRWATHGEPSEDNAHPHTDVSQKIWLVHNGIIENYQQLKEGLLAQDIKFSSATDTEVLAKLMGTLYAGDLKVSVLSALKLVRGTYGIAVMHADYPGEIIVARMGSPIVIGVGEGENFVASDTSALLPHTKRVVYLDDGELAVLKSDSYHIESIGGGIKTKEPETLTGEVEVVKKSGYAHFMLKEIMEGPQVVKDTIRGRLMGGVGKVKLGGLEPVLSELTKIRRLSIAACGSAYLAGYVGKYLLEEYARVPVDLELASEYRYKTNIPDVNQALLVITQSGETADTLAAVREAKDLNLLTLGIVNMVGSTIARETDAGVYNHAGPEVAVASTKAFISELVVLVLMTLLIARAKDMDEKTGKEIVTALEELPDVIEKLLSDTSHIESIAKKYSNYQHMMFIGRNAHVPIAYEGALKLKEVTYIHAEAYAAGELKHGPIALLDENFPVVAIAPQDGVYEKMISNIEEVKARKAPVLALASEGDTNIANLADDVIYLPKVHPILQPIISAIPLHLFAYYVGVAKDLNVDRPRNLAKSVTVE